MTFFTTHKKSLFLIGLAGIIGVMLCSVSKRGNASSPIEADECCRCHFDTCNDSKTKPYVHAPVRENYCGKCHIKQTSTSPSTATSQNKPKIEWFGKTYTLSNEHWFELPAPAENRMLLVQARNKDRQTLHQEITVPQLPEIQAFAIPNTATTISDVTVREIRQGVFLSANITWHTDRICDTKLLYGQNDIQSSSDFDPRWTTKHEMLITGLERKKTYMVAAASQDIFGNETISQPITFSTQTFFSPPSQPTLETTGDIDISPRFFKEKNRIFISFSANQQVTMRLGFAASTAQIETTSLPGQHLPLTDPYELSITVCLSCHPASKGKLSHPIDVPAAKGMTIPQDYPTLAGGKLSCMTCHKPHAADNHFRLIRPKQKDLCLGCHRNF